jgi:outer membrane protein assembly factor BamD (BamD/ComL family)
MRAAIIFAALASWAVLGSAAARTAQAQPDTQASAKEAPSYNALRATHDVEVGKFYLDRGDLHAAISRFKAALLYKKDYAEPCLLLGKAYEKKSDPRTAIHYYKQFLKILPSGPDSKKVREHIAKLQDQLKKENVAAARD